jgi:hypothetical protein
MKNYRSAMGKSIDMGALLAKNESTRAVGNMKVNARGDTIDSQGRIIKPITEKVNQSYANTVGNKSANAVRGRPQPAQPTPASAPIKQKIEEELNPMERELEESLEDDLEIEKIKAEELSKGKK